MSRGGAGDLNIILEAAAGAGFSVTIVQAPSGGAVPDAFRLEIHARNRVEEDLVSVLRVIHTSRILNLDSLY